MHSHLAEDWAYRITGQSCSWLRVNLRPSGSLHSDEFRSCRGLEMLFIEVCEGLFALYAANCASGDMLGMERTHQTQHTQHTTAGDSRASPSEWFEAKFKRDLVVHTS